MRIVAYLDALDLPVGGVRVDGRVITLAALAERAGLREELALLDVRGLLAEDEDLAETRAALARAVRDGMHGVPRAQLRIVAPLEPAKIVGIGWNYRSHVLEQGMPIPDRPLLFAKFSNAVVGELREKERAIGDRHALLQDVAPIVPSDADDLGRLERRHDPELRARHAVHPVAHGACQGRPRLCEVLVLRERAPHVEPRQL